MRDKLNNPNLICFWLYRDDDIADRVQQIQDTMNSCNQMVNKVFTYVNRNSSEYLEQNDLLVLNVHAIKYIEVLAYMFQELSDKISIHTTPELT